MWSPALEAHKGDAGVDSSGRPDVSESNIITGSDLEDSNGLSLDYDSIDWSVLDDIGPRESGGVQTDEQPRSYVIDTGRWHKDNSVLNRVLEILQTREVPSGIHIFPLPPDHDNLVDYYSANCDPNRALYVVNRGASKSVHSRLRPTNPKLSHDWGSSINNQPRIYLVDGRWICNERSAPSGATASLICRGANFNKAMKKHPFERKLKPWRCVPYRCPETASGSSR